MFLFSLNIFDVMCNAYSIAWNLHQRRFGHPDRYTWEKVCMSSCRLQLLRGRGFQWHLLRQHWGRRWLRRLHLQLSELVILLRRHVEEIHPDILAPQPFQSSRWAGYSAETGEIQHRAWRNFEKRTLAYWKHYKPGERLPPTTTIITTTTHNYTPPNFEWNLPW